MALGRRWICMFFDLTNSMSMNMPVAPESMRASTDMGVLLSMVLRHRGMSVPLQRVADRTRRGVLASWGVGCLCTTGSVFGSVVTGDGGVNISLVNPSVLVIWKKMERNEGWDPQVPGLQMRWPGGCMVVQLSCDGHMTKYSAQGLCSVGTSCSDGF